VGLKSRTRSLIELLLSATQARATPVACMRRTRMNYHPNGQVPCTPRHLPLMLHVLAACVLLDVLAACVPMNLHACISKDNSIGEHRYAQL
jgi:hypothetical protein